MAVDFLLRVSVESSELVQEVFAGSLVIVLGSVVIGKTVVADGALGEFLAEKVHFVKEEDEGGLGEPMRIGNGFPQHQCFVHLIL